MIEFLSDNGSLVTVNPNEIVFIRNDNGTAIIKMSTNETIIIDDYDDVINRLQMTGQSVYLDKQTREEAAVDESDDEAE